MEKIINLVIDDFLRSKFELTMVITSPSHTEGMVASACMLMIMQPAIVLLDHGQVAR